MPHLTIMGSDRKLRVDAKFAKRLTMSLWTNQSRGGLEIPTGRLNGRVMTVCRMIGLMAGFPDCQFILPKNGDYFDCRLKNVAPMPRIPRTHPKRVYRNSQSGVRGIRQRDGTFTVVLRVNGAEKHFGSADDLESAKQILAKAERLAPA